MNEMRISDAQLERGLRAIVPADAPVGLHARIHADIETVRQDRPMPGPLGVLSDADPVVRRRAVLLAVAALLAVSLIAAGVAGSLLQRRDVPVPQLSLTAPEDLPTFVRSAYEAMPDLPPMTIHASDSDGRRYRILTAPDGATRIETYASADAAEPETVRLFVGTSTGELLQVDGRPVWHERADAIAEDPRVFVFATLSSARSVPTPGCEVAISEGEVYADTPARGWRWVGWEEVAGRPAHHVACGVDLWIDATTSLVLRARGGAFDDAFQLIPGKVFTIEVTAIEDGAPPADLFALEAPEGVEAIDEVAYECAINPYCGASPAPVVTPPPAEDAAGDPPADLAALAAASIATTDALGPFDVTVASSDGVYPGTSTRTRHDGAGRYHRETTYHGSSDPPSVALAGDDYYYTTELTTDGVPYWREGTRSERTIRYPLRLPEDCDGGWTSRGVDLVLDQPADHLVCPGAAVPEEFWVDRETGLVVRVQATYEGAPGTEVQEVTDLDLGPQPPDLFELPPDATLRP